MRDSSINVEGIRSPLLESGPGQAVEAVVFVHVNPGSSNDWRSLAELVGSFARVIAMDMVGFGAADKPTNFDYSVEGYARHLGALLAASGVRRVDLVLHDFGGPWGLTWAAANPRSIASVTLINTGVLLDYHWHYLAQIWQTRLLGELFMATTTRAGMQLLLRHVNPRGLPREYVEQVYRSLDRGTRRAVLRLYRNSRETQGVMQGIASALRPLALPAQVVLAACDPYIPLSHAERQREVFPRAQVPVFPDSGHWPFIDNPEAVAGAVVPFLRSQVGNGALRPA
jgi:pimeloyl-ACP methyl ester carboxylesterase